MHYQEKLATLGTQDEEVFLNVNVLEHLFVIEHFMCNCIDVMV
jgi:hypothetical protein